MQTDQEQRGGVPYVTSYRGVPPPLVSTTFRAQDDGMAVCVCSTLCVFTAGNTLL